MNRVHRSLDTLVVDAKLAAAKWLYDGRADAPTMARIQQCAWFYAVPFGPVCRVLYTRDVGHHSNGWWKNPDYERCLHLSMSFLDRETGAAMDFSVKRADPVAKAFWGDDRRMAWIEKPYSQEGKSAGVWHYRLFCDAGWQPFQPRAEVYSKEDTPADWKSFSELHGFQPSPENAPFLLNV
jgi:hypothetical protein